MGLNTMRLKIEKYIFIFSKKKLALRIYGEIVLKS